MAVAKKTSESHEIEFDITFELRVKGSFSDTTPLDEMGIENVKQWLIDDLEHSGNDVEILKTKSITLKESEDKQMQLIGVNILKNGIPSKAEYTYKADETIQVGDLVNLPHFRPTESKEYPKGIVTKVGATAIAIPISSVKEIIGKVPDTIYRIIDIQDSATHRTRTDGKYPLRIGRTCRNLMINKGAPLILEYVANADGSDYSNYTLRTSMVLGYEELGGRISVQTMHSIYIFEKENS